MQWQALSDHVGKPVVLSVDRDLDRVAHSVIADWVVSGVRVVREPDADAHARRGDRLSAAVPQFGRVGLGPDPVIYLLAGGALWALVYDGLTRGLVGEMCLVVPVVEGLAEIDHPEQEQKDERQDENELDQ